MGTWTLTLQLDPWDLAALLAVLVILIVLFSWHWQAAVIAVAGVYLWVYYHREKHLAPESPDAGRPAGGQ